MLESMYTNIMQTNVILTQFESESHYESIFLQ